MKSMKKRNKMKRKKRTEKVQLSNSILIFLGFIVLLALLWKVGYFSEITGASIGLGIENEAALESEIAISLPVEEPIIEIPEVNETLNKTFPDTALPNTDNSPYVSNESNGQITLPIESPIIDVPISINESLDDNITDPLISLPINRTIANRTVFNPIINRTRLNQSITFPDETNQSQFSSKNIGLSSVGPFQDCNAVGSASTNRVACTGANEDATDAVSDACTDGSSAGAPDSIRNIFINLTSATGGDWVNITCEVDAFNTQNEVAVLYKNTTSGWVNKMFTAGNPGGVSNQSAAFQIDSDAGQHFVRCWEGYEECTVATTCCTGNYGDNDDLNFSVTTAATTEKTVPFALSTLNGGEFLIVNNSVRYSVNGTNSLNDNNWHHLVATYNGSLMSLYIDGALKASDTTFTGNLPYNNFNLWIGRNYSGSGGYFNGTIDEIRVYNRSLLLEQVKALFNNRTDLITYTETTTGQNWTVDVTPNDGTDDGAPVRSNRVIITDAVAGGGGDTTLPAVTWVTLTQRNYTSLSYNVSFNATVLDTNLSVQSVLFSFNNFSGTPFNTTAVNFSGTWQVLYNVSSLAEGPHLVTVFANDTNNNMNKTEQITFTTDFTIPGVTWITLDQRNYTLTAYNVSFNASISELNLFNVLFSFDNSSGTNFNATAVNFSGTWQVLYNVSSLAKGTHLVTAFANDSSGNVNMTQQLTFRVNNQLPIISSVIK